MTVHIKRYLNYNPHILKDTNLTHISKVAGCNKVIWIDEVDDRVSVVPDASGEDNNLIMFGDLSSSTSGESQYNRASRNSAYKFEKFVDERSFEHIKNAGPSHPTHFHAKVVMRCFGE